MSDEIKPPAKETALAKSDFKFQGGAKVGTAVVVGRMLDASASQLEKALPNKGWITVETIRQSVMMATSKNRAILQCTQESILRSAIIAAQLGLPCDGRLNQGHLVPYGDTCQFMPGYGGFITLAMRDPGITLIKAELVYEDDQFKMHSGTSPAIDHVIEPNADRSKEKIVGAYMIAFMAQGPPHVTYMTKTEIDEIRAGSRARDDIPWTKYYGQQAVKTVIRRGCKTLPLTSEDVKLAMATAEDHDNRVVGFAPVGPPVPDPGRTKEIFAVLDEEEKESA